MIYHLSILNLLEINIFILGKEGTGDSATLTVPSNFDFSLSACQLGAALEMVENLNKVEGYLNQRGRSFQKRYNIIH